MKNMFKIIFAFSVFSFFVFADANVNANAESAATETSSPAPSAAPSPASVAKPTDGQIAQINKEIQARRLQLFHYKKGSNDPMARLQIKSLEEEIATLEEEKSNLQKLPAAGNSNTK